MTITERDELEKRAWEQFLNVFKNAGVDHENLIDHISCSGTLNNVSVAVMYATNHLIEAEE